MALAPKASNEIFNSIASRYDLVNTILSFGFHQTWRRAMAQALPKNSHRVLDIACGTAAIPLALLKIHPEIEYITGLDISREMLKIASVRLKRSGVADRVDLQQFDVLEWRSDKVYDAVTVGFALRNVNDIIKLFIVAYRHVKFAGYFIILEFARPRNIFSRALYNIYLILFVPIAGLLITGNWFAYRHLSQSILEFPDSQRCVRMLRQVGFQSVVTKSLAFGSVTMYIAQK